MPSVFQVSERGGAATGVALRASLVPAVVGELAAQPEEAGERAGILSRQGDMAKQPGIEGRVSVVGGAELLRQQAQNQEAASTDAKLSDAGVGEHLPAQADIDRYRLNLARAARLFRQYPPVARIGGPEGRVVVVVSTVAGMGRPRVSLSQSSGSEILDAQGLSMVDQAISIAELPSGLRGGVFALTLPIHFSSSDPGN